MKPTNEAKHWYLVWFFSVTMLSSVGCGVKGPPVAPEDHFSGTTAVSIEDEPAMTFADGGIIRDGFDPALDELRSKSANSKAYLASLEAREKERTGISSRQSVLSPDQIRDLRFGKTSFADLSKEGKIPTLVSQAEVAWKMADRHHEKFHPDFATPERCRPRAR